LIGACVSLVLILASALLIGQALAGFAGGASRQRPAAASWLAPAYGIAALLVLGGVAIRLPGHATTAAVVLVIATVLAAGYLWRRVSGLGPAAATGAPVIAITVLAAALPFAIAGFVGILGVGLINDDMASHLIIADYISHYSGHVPSFIKGGYPIGPHAVVAGVSRLTGAGLVDVFAGFTVALAPLLGLLGIGLLGKMSRIRLIVGGSLIALPYLGAAYLSQGAFKEPLQAMLLIGFALSLAALVGLRTPLSEVGVESAVRPAVHPLKRVLPAAILAAASVFNYSLPGLLWVAAVGGAVVLARLLLVKPRPELPEDWLRKLAPYALGLLVVVAVATAGEWSRIADFSRISALNPDRFGSELGNLKQALSPLQALGIWPAGEFDATAASAGLPAPIFYLGALIGAAALALGLIRERRERDWTLPALLVAMSAVWVLAALFSSPYIAAKALAIVSPVVIAIALRGTLGARGPALILGIVLVLGAAGSSFLVLRQGAVGPDDHASQLAEIRPLVEGEPVLFLGRDDFIGWELAGSGDITGIVTNFYDVEDARPRFKKGEGGGEKFDVDAVFPQTLDSFRYILATTGEPVSVVPSRFHEAERTEDYVLYERTGSTGKRRTLDEGTAPGAVLDCDTPAGRAIARGKGTAIVWNIPPVIAEADGWRPSDSSSDGAPSEQELRIPKAGRWLISLEYDSRRPLHVSSPELGLDETIPANLDFRGETPTFPVAEVEVDGRTDAAVTVEPEAPNLLGRLLRAPNEAHLRSLTATPLDPDAIERVQVRQTCGKYVDWYRQD
jgi:hypothetical protein